MPGRNERLDVARRHGAVARVGHRRGHDRVNLDFYRYETDDIPDYSIPYARNAANTAPEGGPVDVDRENFYGLVESRLPGDRRRRAHVAVRARLRRRPHAHATPRATAKPRTTTSSRIPTMAAATWSNGFRAAQHEEPQLGHHDGSEPHERERRGARHGRRRAQQRVRLRSEPKEEMLNRRTWSAACSAATP